MGVDVEGEAHEARAFEVLQQPAGERDAVGVEDGLVAVAHHHADDLDDVGVEERVTSRDGHAVVGAPPVEDVEVGLHLAQRLVGAVILPVAALTREVALVGGLQPREHVVGRAPGQAVEGAVVERRHVGGSSGD